MQHISKDACDLRIYRFERSTKCELRRRLQTKRGLQIAATLTVANRLVSVGVRTSKAAKLGEPETPHWIISNYVQLRAFTVFLMTSDASSRHLDGATLSRNIFTWRSFVRHK